MANEEHLAILRQGVEDWNTWREEDPDVQPNLNEADLREADLNTANLRRADFSEADLRRADLSEADLRRATLSRAHLSGANLREAKIGHTIFADTDHSAVTGLETVLHL